jgi:hypothetical protein
MQAPGLGRAPFGQALRVGAVTGCVQSRVAPTAGENKSSGDAPEYGLHLVTVAPEVAAASRCAFPVDHAENKAAEIGDLPILFGARVGATVSTTLRRVATGSVPRIVLNLPVFMDRRRASSASAPISPFASATASTSHWAECAGRGAHGPHHGRGHIALRPSDRRADAAVLGDAAARRRRSHAGRGSNPDGARPPGRRAESRTPTTTRGSAGGLNGRAADPMRFRKKRVIGRSDFAGGARRSKRGLAHAAL